MHCDDDDDNQLVWLQSVILNAKDPLQQTRQSRIITFDAYLLAFRLPINKPTNSTPTFNSKIREIGLNSPSALHLSIKIPSISLQI